MEPTCFATAGGTGAGAHGGKDAAPYGIRLMRIHFIHFIEKKSIPFCLSDTLLFLIYIMHMSDKARHCEGCMRCRGDFVFIESR